MALKHRAKFYRLTDAASEALIGNGLLGARTTAELADTCVSLLRLPERHDALASAGRPIVEANFSFGAVQKTVDAALAGIRPRA